jgi:hypothetical protein
VTSALALFSVSDALAWLLHEGQLPLLVRGGFAVAAMGFQSALMRESLTGSCPTTVMTGNLTQVVIDVVDHVVGRVMLPILRANKGSMRLTPVASSLFVFALSAALGGWLARLYGAVSVALPTALAAALMFQAWREDIAGRAAKGPTSVTVAEFRCPQPWPDAREGKPSANAAMSWPIEPYSIDLSSEPPFKSKTKTQTELDPGKVAPREEEAAEPRRKARSVSGTQLIELKR